MASMLKIDICFFIKGTFSGPQMIGRCSVQIHFPFEPLIADPFPQHLILWLRHVFSRHACMLAMSRALMMHQSTIFILAERLELNFKFFYQNAEPRY